MEKKALIVGVTGGFGGAVTEALREHGWAVRALHRNPDKARTLVRQADGIDWVSGDAMNVDDVLAAAKGCAVIIHGANPAGYKNWRGLAIPMLDHSIAAAKANDARLVFPGNVYNFAADAGPEVTEDTPQHPQTRKGKIRVEMEQAIQRETGTGTGNGLKALIIRAGDFFGPRAPGSWFGAAMVKPGTTLRKVIYPGEHNVGHAWAYLPDMAETVARLLEHEERLEPFAVFHFRGHALQRGVEMAEAVVRAAGGDIPIRALPWPFLYLAAPFAETFREIIEMRYLWKVPIQLDHSKLVAFLGDEPHTPLNDAVRSTLQGMGCLGQKE